MSFSKKMTNKFDSISDLYGRKEARDSLIFDAMVNSLSSPYGDTQLFGVILMIETQGILGPDGTTLPTTPNPTHPFVITARVRPLAPSAESFNLDEPCKYKSDPTALYENLMQHPIAYSETLDGDESLFIPTVGDVVPIYYDLEGPTSSGKRRGLRFRMQRVRRAEGGFDATCIAALGAKLVDGKISLSRVGTPASVIGAGGAGGVAGAAGAISGAGVGATPGTLSPATLAVWPSGVIGVKKGEKVTGAPRGVFKQAMARRAWWMNKANNPRYPQVGANKSGRDVKTIKKPNLLTIVDGTKSRNEKNCWTYDLSVGTDGVKGILVSTYSGIGRGSFSPGAPYAPTKKTKGPAVDYNNGNNSTSAGMKIFGRKRTFKKKTNASIRALQIWGIEPWNSLEDNRGAIAHETARKGSRAVSFGCLATHGNVLDPTDSVHFHAWEIWKGGSWVYFYSGHTDESKAGNVYWHKGPGNPIKSGENRKTWDWSQPQGGHSAPPPKPPRKKKKKKKK